MIQTETTQNGIRMMLSFFPAIGTILGALFMFLYPLNEKKMKEISSDLQQTRLK
jgi:GPH family glycoside/pentoside/hexuronide:cation symporter